MEKVKLDSILIENKLNPNCFHYRISHSGKCSAGELFEINVYENLLLWAKKDNNIKWVCSKNRNRIALRDGLGRNAYGQIVYFVDYLSFAEFDMLFFYNDILVNIEASISEDNLILSKKYSKKIKRNHFMLKKMYGVDKVQTIFLLTKEPHEKIILPENTYFEVVKENNLSLDFSKGLPNKINRPFNKMYKKEVSSIEYHKHLKQFHKKIIYTFFKVDQEKALEELKENIFFERSFLGYIDRKNLDIDIIPREVRKVYLCLNVDSTISYFFVFNKQTFEVYRKNNKWEIEKKRNKFSRSRKMLSYLFFNNFLYRISNTKIKKVLDFIDDREVSFYNV